MVKGDRYYRPDEVAEMLAVDKTTVYRMIKDEEDPMPAIRLLGERVIRIPGDELAEWLKRRRV